MQRVFAWCVQLVVCAQGAAEGAPALHATVDQPQSNAAAPQQENSLAHSLAALPAGLGGQLQHEAARADEAAPIVSTSPSSMALPGIILSVMRLQDIVQ